jgi:NAD-dependent DNA ligase
MQEIAIKNGAEISNNITSKTTLLVVGLDPGKINPINHLGGITGCIG